MRRLEDLVWGRGISGLVHKYNREIGVIISDMDRLNRLAKIAIKYEKISLWESIGKRIPRILVEILITTILTKRLDVGMAVAAGDLILSYINEYLHDRKKIRIIFGEKLFKRNSKKIYRSIRIYYTLKEILEGKELEYGKEFVMFYENTKKLEDVLEFVLPYLESIRESEEESEIREVLHDIREYLRRKKRVYKKARKIAKNKECYTKNSVKKMYKKIFGNFRRKEGGYIIGLPSDVSDVPYTPISQVC